jgi:Domain of unknown function (DUF4234)
MIKERNLAVYLVLTFLTCSIFGIYWLYCMGSDVKKLRGGGDPSPALYVLLSIITCGIFLIYCEYQYPKWISEVQEERGLKVNDLSTLCLVLGICAYLVSGILHFASFALIQNELNEIAKSGSGDTIT